MRKLRRSKRNGGLHVVLVVMQDAADQVIRICYEIGEDVVQIQLGEVAWVAKIVQSFHPQKVACRQAFPQLPTFPGRYLEGPVCRTVEIRVDTKPERQIMIPGILH
jgi:hypothetical protein